MDLGGIDAEEPYALYRVTDAIRLDDGRVVVSSSASDDIRYFGPDGAHIRTSGRTGGGPGEYQNPSALLRGLADSLLVVDGTTRRVSVLDADGDFVRIIDIAESAAVPRIVGRLGDGSLLAAPVIALPPDDAIGGGSEVTRPPYTLVRIPAAGGAPDTLGEFAGAERVIRATTSNGRITSIEIMMLPFAKSPTFAVHDDEVYVGTQDAAEIRVYGLDGGLRRIIRTGRAAETVTEGHLEARWQRQLEGMPEELRADWIARGRDTSLPHGEFVPPYGEIGTDLQGNLWVSDYDDPTNAPGRWTVYDPEGRVLARIALPERFRPFDAGEDWVLGRETDELDVEHVRLYRIVK